MQDLQYEYTIKICQILNYISNQPNFFSLYFPYTRRSSLISDKFKKVINDFGHTYSYLCMEKLVYTVHCVQHGKLT
jgi:hypothetical protein